MHNSLEEEEFVASGNWRGMHNSLEEKNASTADKRVGAG
jgi:hypothetical protein